MDTILALAVLSLGAFIGVAFAAYLYWAFLRPLILERGDATPGGAPNSPHLEEMLMDIQDKLDALSQPEAVPNAEAPPKEILQTLQGYFLAQKQQLTQMSALLNAEISAHGQVIQTLVSQLDQQQKVLESLKNATPGSLESDNLASPAVPWLDLSEQIKAQLQEQADHIQGLDTRLTQAEQAQINLLENIAQQVTDIDSDVDVIKARKTRVLRTIRFTDIKGIGPKYAALLYEAGIHNYQQLGAMTPEEIRNAIRAPKRANVESWIEQAKLFASQEEKMERNT